MIHSLATTDQSPLLPARLALLLVGLSLLAIFVVVLLITIRRSTLTGAGERKSRARSAATLDAWVESGRRLRSSDDEDDDTVDLDSSGDGGGRR